MALRRPERSPNEMPKSHFNVVTQIPGTSGDAGDRTRDANAESLKHYSDLSDMRSEPSWETARTGGDSRRCASDSRQLALSVAKPSAAELEQAVVQAVTAGALLVARVLAERLDARRQERGGRCRSSDPAPSRPATIGESRMPSATDWALCASGHERQRLRHRVLAGLLR